MAYYQVPWAERAGTLQVFGVEAAIVVGITALIIPVLQFVAPRFEVSFGIFISISCVELSHYFAQKKSNAEHKG